MFISSLISLLPSGLLIFVAAKVNLEAVAASMIVIAPFQSYWLYGSSGAGYRSPGASYSPRPGTVPLLA
jgi:hypothetical protein